MAWRGAECRHLRRVADFIVVYIAFEAAEVVAAAGLQILTLLPLDPCIHRVSTRRMLCKRRAVH
ncbi:hypothetical protein AFCDBAGC_3148 [Methylobacterium cerastii]|uniref:Uncharacterized protein n=1 Tax=Methylobacterium cerastii TaxID=932741 RepID=A0ABQ4QK97_9HYPH|nr:hypothetical protein AFCDBAGC_3148 [Methylobacterium cerastii]